MTINTERHHPFSDEELRLATVNYEAQEWLTRELHAAFLMSGLSVGEVASLLDLSLPETSDWLAGNADLSMSDLRHLATALDAHVTYRVDHVVNRLPAWLSSLEDTSWRSVEWTSERLSWAK